MPGVVVATTGRGESRVGIGVSVGAIDDSGYGGGDGCCGGNSNSDSDDGGGDGGGEKTTIN